MFDHGHIPNPALEKLPIPVVPAALPQPDIHDQAAPQAYAGQRLFDLGLCLVLMPLLLPVLALAVAAILWREGGPVFYFSRRMRTPRDGFDCIKLRTMTRRDDEAASGVLGGDRAASVTPLGRLLRRTRVDEFPQLWNVLRGEMGFVGPRPPLPRYVRAHPRTYDQVLATRPGITGLATVIFNGHEARLLAAAATAEETERLYVTRCIPRKARLDRIYRERAWIGLDLYIVYLTAARLLPLPGGRRVRRIRTQARR